CKFTKQGEFSISDIDNIPDGTRCIAHADEIRLGWQQWVDGKPVDRCAGRVADGFVPPRRSELGDLDEWQWELQDDGSRRDPLQFVMAVPITRLDAGGETYNLAFGREIALAPAGVFFGPSLLQASNSRGREPAGVPPEQCDQRVLEVAGRDALEVEDRDQYLQALRPPRVGRQNRRRKADALATFASAVTHARAAHRDRTDTGHDLAIGQMPVAH